ncbi:unnamed protein product, partial [Durusdinium trenchii]
HSESPQVEVAQGDPLWGQRMEQSLASLEPLVEATSRSLQPGSAETAQSNQAQLQGLQPGRSESPRAVAGRAVVVEITELQPKRRLCCRRFNFSNFFSMKVDAEL